MPKIGFTPTALRPILSLVSEDFFYQTTGSSPDIVNLDPDSIIGRAQRLLDRVIGDAPTILRTPTHLDVTGCEIGRLAAIGSARLARIAEETANMRSVALTIMDDPVDGFMVLYNAIVQTYANALYVQVDFVGATNEVERRDFLNDEYVRLRRDLMGRIRQYNAILAFAWGRSSIEEHLDSEPFADIVRSGAIPADFAPTTAN